MPRTLQHLDYVSIGGTTFVAHIHTDEPPCAACSPQHDEEIPIFQHHIAEDGPEASKKRKHAILTETPLIRPRDRDPKKALATLKRSLLNGSTGARGRPSRSQPSEYVDRSARRRALHPDHASATTSISATPDRSQSVTIPPAAPLSAPSAPPAPISTSNVGHRLLMKQGWTPGSALGRPNSENTSLVVPLEPPSTIGRAGIGAPVRPPSLLGAAGDGDWKDEGKRHRWAGFRDSDGNP